MIIKHEKCYICGIINDFYIIENATLFRDATCVNCGATIRNSDTIKIIIEKLLGKDVSLSACIDDFSNYKILEAASCGPIHELLKPLEGYTSFEYIDDIPPGLYENNIMCNDLQDLTYDDQSFDLVITQDVFEHIENPIKAFSEVSRVLKTGGYHVFTVPFHEGRRSLNRAGLAKVYHDDYLRKGGALVYTDWGDDIIELINKNGMETQILNLHKFYDTIDITNVDMTYKEYKKTDPVKYYKYNSIVIVSKKLDIGEDFKMTPNNLINWTGERYIPWANLSSPDIDYEHLNRYYFASQFVKDRIVMDLACGEGYGASILSSISKEVVGIDIDELAIKHAERKYGSENLKFVKGTITEVPIYGDKKFDVITCFEALEHISEQDCLFKEIKRLLKEDGILIISSPNKQLYTDIMKQNNPYHLKELYFNEFAELITNNFSDFKFLGQKVLSGSLIWPLEEFRGVSENHYIQKNGDYYEKNNVNNLTPLYYIAVASNKALPEKAFFSNTIDLSDELKKSFTKRINEIEYLSNLQKQEIFQLSKLYDEIEIDRDNKSTETKQLNENLTNANEKVSELSKLNNKRETEINNLNEEIKEAEKTINDQKLEILYLKSNINDLNVNIANLSESIKKKASLYLEVINSHTWKYTTLLRKSVDFIKKIIR